MPAVLLAPYNDSMRLGQGFNSFLQQPRINGAVKINKKPRDGGSTKSLSQVVSYSSRFVEKISDIVRSMNISAGSSIKGGTIEVSGNSLSIDEAKFASSDLNAVVSVKVINQTYELIDDTEFLPPEGVGPEGFFNHFGDTYISGFIEGGDLHGIISIKVLNSSNKSTIENVIKSKVNGSGKNNGFTLSDKAGLTQLQNALNQTETTITVNWSGGGQIKHPDEEWSLENLFHAAASFPNNVTACPQRTWAILTRYDQNRSFLKWAFPLQVVVPQYNRAESYAADLLDMYMEYKHNLAKLRTIIHNPSDYVARTTSDAVEPELALLLELRAEMRKQMNLITDQIDKICDKPSIVSDLERDFSITSPEQFAARMPIRTQSVATTFGHKPQSLQNALQKLPLKAAGTKEDPTQPNIQDLQAQVKALQAQIESIQSILPPADTPPTDYPPISVPYTILPQTYAEPWPHEIEWITTRSVPERFTNLHYHIPVGRKPVVFEALKFFDDFDVPGNQSLKYPPPTQFPTGFQFMEIKRGDISVIDGWEVIYADPKIYRKHIPLGASDDQVVSRLQVRLFPGEYVFSVIVSLANDGSTGISFLQLMTTSGFIYSIGSKLNAEQYRFDAPENFVGLKGFWGRFGGNDKTAGTYRVAPIWGRFPSR